MTSLSRLRALVLLAAMLWQTVGMLDSYRVSQRAVEFEHLTVHMQVADHHHHADHSLHMDVDESMSQHFHADAGSTINGIPSTAISHRFDSNSALISDLPSVLWQSPTLDGPLRPPRHIV